MAIEMGTATLAVSTEERTWRVNIETPKGGDPIVTVFRETVRTDGTGTIISKEPTATVTRSLSATAAQSFTLGGATYTTGLLAAFIASVADVWRTEDLSH